MSNQPEVPSAPEINYDDEKDSRLARKSKDSPMMVLGLTGCAAVAAYGLYKFKHRGNISASNYLMQLRVTAQGVAIGCVTLGITKALYDNYIKKKTD